MTYQGRSLDDLPLAAYSTGVKPNEDEEPPKEEAPHLSQQEVLAQAMGIAPPSAEATPAAAAAPARKRRSLGVPKLPRPRLPKPQLALPGRSAAATDDDGPRMTPAPARSAPAMATSAAMSAASMSAASAMPAQGVTAAPAMRQAPPHFVMPAQAGGAGGAITAPRAGKLGSLDLGGPPPSSATRASSWAA
jgi:hypothetical protein